MRRHTLRKGLGYGDSDAYLGYVDATEPGTSTYNQLTTAGPGRVVRVRHFDNRKMDTGCDSTRGSKNLDVRRQDFDNEQTRFYSDETAVVKRIVAVIHH